MAYNRRNLLNRILEIQEIYLKYKLEGVTTRFIFDNHIHTQYRISYTTFNTYLGVNAKRELKELDNAKDNNDKSPVQGSLDL